MPEPKLSRLKLEVISEMMSGNERKSRTGQLRRVAYDVICSSASSAVLAVSFPIQRFCLLVMTFINYRLSK